MRAAALAVVAQIQEIRRQVVAVEVLTEQACLLRLVLQTQAAAVVQEQPGLLIHQAQQAVQVLLFCDTGLDEQLQLVLV
jgi:hypothetical protein